MDPEKEFLANPMPWNRHRRETAEEDNKAGAVPSLPLLATYHDDSFGVGVYPVFLRPASPHDPCYLVTVDEQELSLLIKEVHLLVSHVVAEELASAAHAEGSEGVAGHGCAYGQWP